ncbi:hypothetical protein BG015_000319 [Linnemannia schmuckeri]|uniref:Uncharacterized protein n=1 Tax=Linnemannia schmuckeri TaxID=64567 RepID=A0A9P5V764_9FUNG|nr:hypothetical protein BG015_000319 [Linnemannia schmuckeri]
MLRTTLLTVAAIIQVITLSVVTGLDAGRYTLSRGEVFLIPGARAGEVMPRQNFDKATVSAVWVVDLNADNTYYTLKYETSQKFMSYNDITVPAAVGTKLLTNSTSHPFRLELIDAATQRHRIHPPTDNNVAVCGAASDIYAKFCAVNNVSPTTEDPDFWDFTLASPPTTTLSPSTTPASTTTSASSPTD